MTTTPPSSPPAHVPDLVPGLRQSLARGAAGEALLPIARAHHGATTWAQVHTRLQNATGGPLDGGAHTGLYYGVPAIAFLLSTAAAHPAYAEAAMRLDPHLLRIARTRLTAVEERRRAGADLRFTDYDLFCGLTGIAALLLRRCRSTPALDEHADVLTAILRCLIHLTEPHPRDPRAPGWWVQHDPDPNLPTPGGHANLGMAHGAAGILALLALTTRHGHHAPGHREAIERLLAVFDTWAQPGPTGPWWPHWITAADLAHHGPARARRGRPSWCYGTPGIARALQLAAIATGDHARQDAAEHALAGALHDTELDRITDPGLCHGIAGTFHTTHRAAADARTPGIATRLPVLAERLHAARASAEDNSLLTGNTGLELARDTARGHDTLEWDACLLIT